MATSPPFMQSTEPPYRVLVDTLAINDDEFLVIPDEFEFAGSSQKFNVLTNAWSTELSLFGSSPQGSIAAMVIQYR